VIRTATFGAHQSDLRPPSAACNVPVSWLLVRMRYLQWCDACSHGTSHEQKGYALHAGHHLLQACESTQGRRNRSIELIRRKRQISGNQ
jgi:hypothetical protein